MLGTFAHPVACSQELLRKVFETGQKFSSVQTDATTLDNVGLVVYLMDHKLYAPSSIPSYNLLNFFSLNIEETKLSWTFAEQNFQEAENFHLSVVGKQWRILRCVNFIRWPRDLDRCELMLCKTTP